MPRHADEQRGRQPAALQIANERHIIMRNSGEVQLCATPARPEGAGAAVEGDRTMARAER